MVKPNKLEYSLSTTLVIETCPPFPHECPPIWAPFECRTFHQGLLLGTCKKKPEESVILSLSKMYLYYPKMIQI